LLRIGFSKKVDLDDLMLEKLNTTIVEVTRTDLEQVIKFKESLSAQQNEEYSQSKTVRRLKQEDFEKEFIEIAVIPGSESEL